MESTKDLVEIKIDKTDIPETENETSRSQVSQLLNLFRSSAEYRHAFEGFFQGKNLDPDITEEEKLEAFEQSDKASLLLLDQAIQSQLSFDPTEYSDLTAMSIQRYISATRKMKNALGKVDNSAFVDLDRERSIAHNNAAAELVAEGFVPNKKMGREICKAFLISEGLESEAAARVRDITKIENMYK